MIEDLIEYCIDFLKFTLSFLIVLGIMLPMIAAFLMWIYVSIKFLAGVIL